MVRNNPVLMALPCSFRVAHKVGVLPRVCGRQHSKVSKLASMPHRTSTMLPLQLLRNVRGRRWCCGGTGGGARRAGGGAAAADMLMPPFGGWLFAGAAAWWRNCLKMPGMLSSPHSWVRRRRYLCPCRW